MDSSSLTCDPSDVGDASEDVVLVVISEDVLLGESGVDEVAGGGVGHALGGPGASLRDVTGIANAMTQFFFQLVQFGV